MEETYDPEKISELLKLVKGVLKTIKEEKSKIEDLEKLDLKRIFLAKKNRFSDRRMEFLAEVDYKKLSGSDREDYKEIQNYWKELEEMENDGIAADVKENGALKFEEKSINNEIRILEELIAHIGKDGVGSNLEWVRGELKTVQHAIIYRRQQMQNFESHYSQVLERINSGERQIRQKITNLLKKVRES